MKEVSMTISGYVMQKGHGYLKPDGTIVEEIDDAWFIEHQPKAAGALSRGFRLVPVFLEQVTQIIIKEREGA